MRKRAPHMKKRTALRLPRARSTHASSCGGFTEKRPWGSFRELTGNERTTVKILTVNPKQEFSLQYHTHRKELWKVLSGAPRIVIGKKAWRSKNGQEFLVPPYVLHRIRAGNDPATVLEISFGRFDESDIVRIEDDYGRTSPRRILARKGILSKKPTKKS